MSCSGSCSSCSTADSCSSKKKIEFEPMNQYSKVKKVIGIVSGKGGVGKSLTTSYLSVLMNRKGYQTAILDADITGPSIPKTFGVHSKAVGNEFGILPAITQQGTKIMSVNLLLDGEEMPVVWRGPVIAGTVKQFWTDVIWDKVDYMFVDMPPGTGDVPLTVFQSIPLDGIIIVTSPQELVSMIVGKAVNMAKAMNVPILGLVENYSYITCGSCGEKISVFGESHVEEVAEKYNLKALDRIPIDTNIAKAVDAGKIEELQHDCLNQTADYIETVLPIEEDVMKQTNSVIAVPVDDSNNINPHFGKATDFRIYEIQYKTLVSQITLQTEGTGHEANCAKLQEAGVSVVICGGIGQAALDFLMDHNITVIPFMDGDVNVAVASYLDGAVVATDISSCMNEQEECCGNGCSDCNH